MRNGIFLLLLLICFASGLTAQRNGDPKTVTAEGKSNIPLENMNMDQARALAIQMAKVNALESVFPEKIFDADLLNIRNLNKNGEISTLTDYQKISRSFIGGHWVRDIEEPQIKIRVDEQRNEVWIEAKVHGEVKKLIEPPFNIQAHALNCNQPQCIQNTFRQFDRLYASFQSEVDGYLAVYLDVRSKGVVQRFLPDNQHAFPIKANQPYLLFDKIGPGVQLVIEDEDPSIKQESEIDILYFIFSTEEFYQPSNLLIEEEKIDLSLVLPPEVSREDFEEWLAKLILWEKVKVIEQVIEIKE